MPGHIEPDTLAIRRELVVCPYCATINRITALGTEKYEAALIEGMLLPDGVKVKPLGEGHLQITAKAAGRHRYTPPMLGQENGCWFLIPGALFALSWFSLLFFSIAGRQNGEPVILNSDALFFSFCVVPFLALFIYLVVAQQLFPYLPVVQVKAGEIHPASSVNGSVVAVPDIRQIYAAVTTITERSRQAADYCYVYVLTQDEKRRPLIGPIRNKEDALAIEELLEVELGLFQLPVYGDTDLPTTAPVAPEPTAVSSNEDLICMSCAASLMVTNQVQQQGYVVCDYCQGLTLLYRPDKKPVLGLPAINSPSFHYKVEKENGRLFVRARQQNYHRDLLQLTKGTIHIQVDPDAPINLPVTDIKTIYVKKHTHKDHLDPEGKFTDVDEAVKASPHMDEVLPYSMQHDRDDFLLKSHALLSYRVVAKTNSEQEIHLLYGLRNLPEAFSWAYFLDEFRRKAN